MSKLQAALAWAARGFPVFPLQPNTKLPAFDDSWYDTATTDPSAIQSMWTDPVLHTERDYNIGVDCSRMVVVDVDVKEGKDGHNQYVQLGGNYDTLVVQTPTGGYHCYFNGDPSANVNLDRDIEIRSYHGYVVGPGSTIDGVPYSVLRDLPVAWVLEPVSRRLSAPKERVESTAGGLDHPATVEAARGFLETHAPAVEGQRGDEATYITACYMVRDYGLSVFTAFELMRDHWNPRCQPPWQHDELLAKIEHAHEYGTQDVGKLDPTVLFADVGDIPEIPTIFEQVPAIQWGNAFDPLAIPPRPWIIDTLLMLHETTLFIAPGSAGKSTLILAVAAHLALGKNFGPYRTHIKCRSVIYNGEDNLAEMSRRLYAICNSYGLLYDEVRQNVMLISADLLDLKLARSEGRKPIIDEVAVQQLIDMLAPQEVGFFGIDPFVDIHDSDENDNPQMNAVMRVVKRIAKQANVAVGMAHHTVKLSTGKQEDHVGNMSIARGASGVINKSRLSFTLLNATESDCETYGLQDHERREWVRLDDAKLQYTLAGKQTLWFKKEGIHIPSGDVVGVLKYQELRPNTQVLKLRVADILMSHMITIGTATMTMKEAVAIVRVQEPLWAAYSDTEISKRLTTFTIRCEVRGRSVQLRRENEKQTPHFVLS